MAGSAFDKPILQVLGAKRVPGIEGIVRYRLIVSDGNNLITYAMLTTQLNDYDENQLAEKSIIRIEKYVVSLVSQEK